MYQLRDIFDTNLVRKDISAANIHLLHQHRDQITGVEERKSGTRKKKRQLVARVNLNMNNRIIAAKAKAFLEKNKPIQVGEKIYRK